MQSLSQLNKQLKPFTAGRPRLAKTQCRAVKTPLSAVVITGASSGIGKAASLHMAKQGWHVFAGVRRHDDGKDLTKSFERETGSETGCITPVIIDVTKADTCKAAAQEVSDILNASGGGRLRGLVNNAGKVTLAPLEHMPVEVFEDQLQVNLVGALRVTQAFLPLMRQGSAQQAEDGQAATGRIINISSQSGTVAFPLFGGYCASKFGLEAFNDCLKYELADQAIDVVCIKPGPVKTDIWSRAKGTSTQVLSGLSPEANARYGQLIDKITRATRSAEDNGGSSEDIAQLIQAALTEAKPRDRYLYGKSATVQMVLRRLLPDRIWNPLVLSNLKKL